MFVKLLHLIDTTILFNTDEKSNGKTKNVASSIWFFMIHLGSFLNYKKLKQYSCSGSIANIRHLWDYKDTRKIL